MVMSCILQEIPMRGLTSHHVITERKSTNSFKKSAVRSHVVGHEYSAAHIRPRCGPNRGWCAFRAERRWVGDGVGGASGRCRALEGVVEIWVGSVFKEENPPSVGVGWNRTISCGR